MEPSDPGVSVPITSSLPATKETGRIPPPAAFPHPIISGLIPYNWCAKFAPVRPNPVWTSSIANKILYFLHNSDTFGQ